MKYDIYIEDGIDKTRIMSKISEYVKIHDNSINSIVPDEAKMLADLLVICNQVASETKIKFTPIITNGYYTGICFFRSKKK